MAYKHQYITVSREDHEYRLALKEIRRELNNEHRKFLGTIRTENRAKKRIERSSAKPQLLK